MPAARGDFEHVYKRRDELMQEGKSDQEIVEVISQERGVDTGKLYNALRQWVKRKRMDPNPNNMNLNPRTAEWREREGLKALVEREYRQERHGDARDSTVQIQGVDFGVAAERIAERYGLPVSDVSWVVKTLGKHGRITSQTEEHLKRRNDEIISMYQELGVERPYEAAPIIRKRLKPRGSSGRILTAAAIKGIIHDALNIPRRAYTPPVRASPEQLDYRVQRREELMQEGRSDSYISKELALEEVGDPSNGAEVKMRAKGVYAFFNDRIQRGALPENPNKPYQARAEGERVDLFR